MLVAAPILALDKIGTELQFPFASSSLNHLPMDQLCLMIETNLLALLDEGDPLPRATPWNASASTNGDGATPIDPSTATRPVTLEVPEGLAPSDEDGALESAAESA
jgi:putative membrane protein